MNTPKPDPHPDLHPGLPEDSPVLQTSYFPSRSLQVELHMDLEDADLRSILVIDDDEIMRELLSALLGLHGYQVTLADSGERALALLRSGLRPAYLLADLHLPGIRGEELASALREILGSPVPLIAMSASQPPPAQLQAFDAFLLKPFDNTRLQRTLLDASARTRPDPTGPEAAPEPSPSAVPLLDEGIFTALLRSFQPEQLRNLYVLTLDDVAQRHSRMLASAAAGDLAAVQKEAHAIKGGCGMMGARELQEMASIVEAGTTISTSALAEFPAACLRLRRMLDAKFQSC